MSNGVWSNNFLSDIPTIGLARDSVDPEQVERPRRWNMRFIGRFMIAFGAISSVFDLLTFGILLFALRSTAPGYVLATELAKRPFYRAVSGEAELASVHQASVPPR